MVKKLGHVPKQDELPKVYMYVNKTKTEEQKFRDKEKQSSKRLSQRWTETMN